MYTELDILQKLCLDYLPYTYVTSYSHFRWRSPTNTSWAVPLYYWCLIWFYSQCFRIKWIWSQIWYPLLQTVGWSQHVWNKFFSILGSFDISWICIMWQILIPSHIVCLSVQSVFINQITNFRNGSIYLRLQFPSIKSLLQKILLPNGWGH